MVPRSSFFVVNKTNATDSMTHALLPFIVQITSTVFPGDYQALVAAIDGEGNRSNELSVSFTIQ